MTPASQGEPQLEKYELLGELGHGGMATVYRARDRRLGREVALKVIHRHLRQNSEVARRFTREARAVAKLRHDNIVEVYDVSDESEPERYLVMELVRGQSLRELLATEKALPVEVAAAIALEVARAVEHAHSEGIIHRDIKPENVLLECERNDRGEVGSFKIKLTDFGIAKMLDAQGVTSTGQVLGSPAHMAPEQIEGGDVGPPADVFGLGVLLYELLTGNLPFRGSNPAQVLRRVLEGDFEPIERVDPRVGTRWGELLSRALARQAAERFQTADAFATAIGAELKLVGVEEPRRELATFLLEPTSFRSAFETRILASLLKAAERARKANRLTEAAAHFNRALAYSPGNREVLSQISRLNRLSRVRWAAYGAVLVGMVVAVVVVGGRWAADRWSRGGEVGLLNDPPGTVDGQPQIPDNAAAELPNQGKAQATRADPEVGRAKNPADNHATSVRSGQRTALPQRVVSALPVELDLEREVRVFVVGALGGSLRIDGRPLEWFGKTHRLTHGPHRFEFVPPNPICCEGSELTVEIEPGNEPQVVRGQIAFRDARLQVSSLTEERAKLTCPTILSSELAVPGETTVPMAQAELQARCTVKPAAPLSSPVQKIVTLRAGETTALSWP